MLRMVEVDIPQALASKLPAWLASVMVAAACLAVMGSMRLVLDKVYPGIAPFALIFPFVLLATLTARWLAGAITGLVSLVYASVFLLPPGPLNAPIIVFVGLNTLLTVAVAEIYRLGVRRAAAERDRQIEQRDLFLAEVEHRVKNNFAIVASLLELQRRRADPATAEALGAALARVESIARAHRHLYRKSDRLEAVEISGYLQELCAALRVALGLRDWIRLDCTADQAELNRDRAVSIGLIVNELVTNAAKHAFVGRETGSITVTFTAVTGGWRLCIADDGVGVPEELPAPTRQRGLGTRLVGAFAQQAGGTLSIESGPGGTTTTLALSA